MLLSRESLLKPADRRFQDYKLPDGRAFRVRSLTEAERSQWEMATVDGKGKPVRDKLLSARRRLVCLTLVDDQNRPLLSADDESLLASQDGGMIEAIYKAAAEHCGITNSDVETLVKNSPETSDAA